MGFFVADFPRIMGLSKKYVIYSWHIFPEGLYYV